MLYGYVSNKKHRKGPDDPTKMHTAQKENFAIYLLRGILAMAGSSAIISQIPPKLRNEIEVAAMQAIMCIKDKQAIRMMNNADAKSRKPKPYAPDYD